MWKHHYRRTSANSFLECKAEVTDAVEHFKKNLIREHSINTNRKNQDWNTERQRNYS